MAIPGLQTTVLAMVFGVTSYTLARKLRIPAILFYLLAGLAAGPMGLGLINTSELGPALLTLVEIAVAIILFEGGLSLKSQEFQSIPAAIRRILILTIPLTALSAFVLSWQVMGLSWDIAVVFGALIVVTGPTVIGPLLKSISLTPRLEILLLWESIWGDVIGVLLTALALEFLFLAKASSVGSMGLELSLLILDGLVIGFIGGFLLGRFILPWASHLGDRGIPGIITFTAALAIFYLANLLKGSAGPLAVAVAGFVLSQQRGTYLQGVRHFKDQISVIFIATLFVLLSAHVNLFDFSGQFWTMLLVAIVLGAIVRPLAVFLSLIGTGISFKEQLYIGLIGPRGIVALAAASYAALMVPGRETEMSLLMNAVFVIIFFSGAFTTLAGRSLASWLKLTVSMTRSGLLVAGANPFSLKLVEFARKYVPVAFLDTNRFSCQLLEDSGHTTVCPDVLDDQVYEQAKEEGYDRLLALTHDDALNQLICEKAAIHLGEEHVAMAQGNSSEGLMIEPISDISQVFSDDFFVAEAIRKINLGQAHFEIAETYTPEPGLYPLIRETADGGVEIVRDGERPDGPVLCLRQTEDEALGIDEGGASPSNPESR
jgi:NhaP-type Na+/H+ or K+/H+ antiporter